MSRELGIVGLLQKARALGGVGEEGRFGAKGGGETGGGGGSLVGAGGGGEAVVRGHVSKGLGG